jgi:hypothetical protein
MQNPKIKIDHIVKMPGICLTAADKTNINMAPHLGVPYHRKM